MKVTVFFKTVLEDASPDALTWSLLSPAFCLFPEVLQHMFWLVRVPALLSLAPREGGRCVYTCQVWEDQGLNSSTEFLIICSG